MAWRPAKNRKVWRTCVQALVCLMALASHEGSGAPGAEPAASAVARQNTVAPLRADGRYFRDASDRVVFLRGFNLAGDSKVPPFSHVFAAADLDRLPAMGANTIRLLFNWEAFESEQGVYDYKYLGWLKEMAAEAGRRGLYVIVDFHQDVFSRHAAEGCGDGFPKWAVWFSVDISKLAEPNGAHCADWGMKGLLSPTMHLNFNRFYANSYGVRTSYINLWRRLAREFREIGSVIGYDLLNEPWGDEQTEIDPLYRDVAAVIRAEHPSAILLLEPHLANGIVIRKLGQTVISQTQLPLPADGPRPMTNVVYAPHYYQSDVMEEKHWDQNDEAIVESFRRFDAVGQAWQSPVILGEFGTFAHTKDGMAYLDRLIDEVNRYHFSALQWSYTPGWTPDKFDGWNREDLSVIDDKGQIRSFHDQDGRIQGLFRYRPYAQKIAGVPQAIVEHRNARGYAREFIASWHHDPALGATEIYAPSEAFEGTWPALATSGEGLVCQRDAKAPFRLVCRSPHVGLMKVTLRSPPK